MTEWPATIDRRYHDAVILGLDCVVTETALVLGPHWPEALGPIEFAFVYHGQRLHLRISGRAGTLTSEAGNAEPVPVECRGRVQYLLPGHTIEVE